MTRPAPAAGLIFHSDRPLQPGPSGHTRGFPTDGFRWPIWRNGSLALTARSDSD